ncbi:MAG: Beta-ketoacyl synthase [Verrucomicrobiales bacterium]|nr:Beta-ketoacyl synthase [Verrucomicrobiales bacterium]
MSSVFVCGLGAVSPAGWGVEALRHALQGETTMPVSELSRPGWDRGVFVRRVPAPAPRPAFLAQARLRRSSPISHFVVGAALEALGTDAPAVAAGTLRLGIVLCVMSGCVNYSKRFYDETLKDPSTASPLVFPETVFNAPCSHLSALLGATGLSYTMVGDPGTFVQGLALAGQWLVNGEADGCLVIGAEECDWITADAFRHFQREFVLSEGSGAVYLKTGEAPESSVELEGVTDSFSFINYETRLSAAKRMRAELPEGTGEDILCESTQGLAALDAPEIRAWQNWPGKRIAPKKIFGEGLTAATAWQSVAGIQRLAEQKSGKCLVSVAGCNQQVIGACFSHGSSADL